MAKKTKNTPSNKRAASRKPNHLTKSYAKIRSVLSSPIKINNARDGLIATAILSMLALGINYLLVKDNTLRDNITAEIIGSGIFAGFITYLFFRLQNASEYEASKIKAESYYNKKALPDFKEIFEDQSGRGWSLNLGYDFYLSSSVTNNLFKTYEENLDIVIAYESYNPEDVFLKSMEAFYILVRKIYTLGKLSDDRLRSIIRAEHHKQSVISMNDGDMFRYVRAKLFIPNIDDEEIIKNLDWDQVNERAANIIKIAKADKVLMECLEKLTEFRSAVLKLVEIVEYSQTLQLSGSAPKSKNKKG